MRARHGFTLIELLVVIAIIAMLIGLMLPALARARNLGKQAACLANMRGLGMASAMYAGENRELIPREGHLPNPRNQFGVPRPVTYFIWGVALRPFIDAGATPGYAVKTDLFEHAKEYRCAGRVNDGHFIHYLANGYAFSSPGELQTPGGRNPDPRRRPTRMSAIGRPSDVIHFSELGDDTSRSFYRSVYESRLNPLTEDGSVGQMYDLFDESHISTTSGAIRLAPRRHRDGSNVCFLDGHAALIMPERLTDVRTWDDGVYNMLDP